MRDLVLSIEAEFLRYKSLGEGAIGQLRDEEFSSRSISDNSVTTLVWHISGNLKSRFTDFLSSDGEKPWRDRESEFEERSVGRAALMAKWGEGWDVLRATLADLSDEHLNQSVVIRGVLLLVHEALHRALAHISYHVGQIVLIARSIRGAEWTYLSIPRGQSSSYNVAPVLEKPPK